MIMAILKYQPGPWVWFARPWRRFLAPFERGGPSRAGGRGVETLPPDDPYLEYLRWLDKK